MSRRERDILERAVAAVADQARRADVVVDEARIAGLPGDHELTIQAKLLRQELLEIKGDLERELTKLVPNCRTCGLDVHWVEGFGVQPGHWGHREPAPHGDPVV